MLNPFRENPSRSKFKLPNGLTVRHSKRSDWSPPQKTNFNFQFHLFTFLNPSFSQLTCQKHSHNLVLSLSLCSQATKFRETETRQKKTQAPSPNSRKKKCQLQFPQFNFVSKIFFRHIRFFFFPPNRVVLSSVSCPGSTDLLARSLFWRRHFEWCLFPRDLTTSEKQFQFWTL